MLVEGLTKYRFDMGCYEYMSGIRPDTTVIIETQQIQWFNVETV